MLSLAIFIPAGLFSIVLLGAAAGLVAINKEEQDHAASERHAAIQNRNGVTGVRIPFAGLDAPTNVPGFVEVYPRSRREPAASTDTRSHIPAHSPTRTSAPTPAPHFQRELPPLASVGKSHEQSASPASASTATLPKLPIDFAEAANETEAEAIVTHWETGASMTKTIKAVWGISAGGGVKYKNARSRYKHYLSEVRES